MSILEVIGDALALAAMGAGFGMGIGGGVAFTLWWTREWWWPNEK